MTIQEYGTSQAPLDFAIQELSMLDFSSIDNLSAVLPGLLERLSSREMLSELIRRFRRDDALLKMSERLAELDKLVLYVDRERDIRIRMHVFRQGYWDRPHNHRFTFATRLLAGSYVHTVYGHATDSSAIPDDLLVPRLRMVESRGGGYVIEHTLVHSVAAMAQTVTLTVRGPAQKPAMLIVGDEGPFWAYGAADETEAQLNDKRLTAEQIETLCSALEQQEIIN